MDRPRQPGHRGAAPALRLPRRPDPRRARALSADHPARLVHRPLGQAPARPQPPPRSWARRTVVVHPPFRWQRQYARDFVTGIWRMADETDVRFAVENMYPWRYRDREMLAYAPDWDVTKDDYRHFTIDLSHTATARTDAIEMIDRMGDRLGHVHLADGKGSAKDEHLVPGRGTPALRRAAGAPRPDRLRRPCRHRGQHPPRDVQRRTRGRPRRGAGLHPPAPRLATRPGAPHGDRPRRPARTPPGDGPRRRRRGRRPRPAAPATASWPRPARSSPSAATTRRRCAASPRRQAWTPRWCTTTSAPRNRSSRRPSSVAFAPALDASGRHRGRPARRRRRAPDPLHPRRLGEPGHPCTAAGDRPLGA